MRDNPGTTAAVSVASALALARAGKAIYDHTGARNDATYRYKADGGKMGLVKDILVGKPLTK